MKIAACLLLVAGLIGGATLFEPLGLFGRGGGSPEPVGGEAGKDSSASSSVTGPPKKEWYAIALCYGHVDGPKLEASITGEHTAGIPDDDGNLWIYSTGVQGALRVIRADNGMVETVAGEDRWGSDLNLAEGPASFFPELSSAQRAMARGFTFVSPAGSPLKGEEYGCVYAGEQGSPFKIYRNKEKDGRWWFKRLGNTGKVFLPTETGKTVKIDEVNLTGAQIGKGRITYAGCYYEYDEAKGEARCVLSPADYANLKHPNPKGADKWKPGKAEHIVRGPDGSFYLRWYVAAYGFGGVIFRISSDRSKADLIAWGKYGDNSDSSSTEGHFFGGPMIGGVVDDVMLIHVVDGNCIRRITLKDLRTSKLCVDGEWRELPYRSPVKIFGAKGWVPDPARNCVWFYRPGEEGGGDIRMYKIYPVDFTKPTVSGGMSDGSEKKAKEQGKAK